MAEQLAAVAKHKLGRVAKLIADHASIIAAIVLEHILVFENHGRVDVGDLLSVFNSI
jgi:hypothetical protein